MVQPSAVIRFRPVRFLAFLVPAFLGVVTAGLLGCVTLPNDHRTLQGDARGFVRVASAPCALAPAAADPVGETPGLNAERFRVLTWNVHRSGDAGWRADFVRFAADHDVLALQEAYFTDDLYGVLWDGHFHWRLSASFRLFDIDAGVLTASRGKSARHQLHGRHERVRATAERSCRRAGAAQRTGDSGR